MLTVVAVIHIIACLLLIALVLLQDPKASGGSTMFGGTGSSNVIGATGGASLLQKMTRYAAIVFGVCCLLLTILSRRDSGSGSVFDNLNSAAPTAPISAPAAPGTSAPAAPGAATPNTAPGTTVPAAPTTNAPVSGSQAK
ncbi:MAG: preprotein translocase subunit SecG [Deltaproteobacteria bacterium]|nr:preprotein translocase subunit SecG [Deltaproteobacteria bacterium]